jgi:hypothetical protein
MTYRVFHSLKTGFGFEPATFPEDFRHVADVRAYEIGAVFQLTNHIDRPWTENEEVLIPSGVNPRELRSTSVGDLVQDGNKLFAVAPCGFRLVEDGIHVPDLYAEVTRG